MSFHVCQKVSFLSESFFTLFMRTNERPFPSLRELKFDINLHEASYEFLTGQLLNIFYYNF